MNALSLSPLPSPKAETDSESRIFEREGFVDEELVAAIARQPTVQTRRVAYPPDLILAADDLDFAGWQLPAPSIEAPQPAEIPLRRPAPPVAGEPGLGQPYADGHRWWLAGLAGVLCTMLFSLLLLTLAARQASHFETSSPQQAASTSPPAPVTIEAPRHKAQPDMAETSTGDAHAQRSD